MSNVAKISMGLVDFKVNKYSGSYMKKFLLHRKQDFNYFVLRDVFFIVGRNGLYKNAYKGIGGFLWVSQRKFDCS